MRPLAIVVAGLVIAVLAVWQTAALALFGPLAHPPSFAPAFAATWPFAAAHATGLDRTAPVRVELARAAYVRGENDRADALLAGVPADDDVADVRGRIALARGDLPAAIASFADAGDSSRARDAIAAVATHDPLAALGLANAFERALIRHHDDPARIADAAWRAGALAATAASLAPAAGDRYRRDARAFYDEAVRYDQTQETYQLSAGFEALALGDAPAARVAYARAHDLAPNGIDALVGLALSSAASGDCATARDALARARDLAPHQHRTADPATAGFDRTSRAALARCLGS